ncbi:hypothetical protein THER5_1969 [Bifidobacterium thermacidophilum subsp. thermacidophilum]|uniref:Uncharacterized protein n=1 Tax=Bifidobacterium thermacidophilum subsp. thermacidophilum TaxID=79262 RepID=A0A087EAS5_9BIFI|nr:hypothetical protein THER5_1969 [Bifidobacterium thermacidophilum subsp. thermacidophilum]
MFRDSAAWQPVASAPRCRRPVSWTRAWNPPGLLTLTFHFIQLPAARFIPDFHRGETCGFGRIQEGFKWDLEA